MIEFQTKLSKVEIVALNRFHLVKKTKFATIFCSVVFMMFGGLIYFTADSRAEGIFGIVFGIVFGLGYLPLCLLVLKIVMHFQLKTSKMISGDNNVHAVIEENQVTIESKKEDYQSSATMGWSMVYRAYETKDYFFLYISNNQSFVLSTDSIVQGSAEELRELLHMKLGKKFKSSVKIGKAA